MAISIKVSSNRTNQMVKVFTNGLMETLTKDCGRKEREMVRVYGSVTNLEIYTKEIGTKAKLQDMEL